MKTEQRHSLYRHFAADGTLLYIGISLSAVNRLGQHRDHAHWFATIARVEIEHFPTRQAALQAEREAVGRENPKHNIQLRSEAKVHHLRVPPELEADNQRDQSRRLLTREVVFKPLYTPDEAARLLGVGTTKVRQWIEDGQMGAVVLGERWQNTKHGPRHMRHLGITGWQMIEFIEAMERGAALTVAA